MSLHHRNNEPGNLLYNQSAVTSQLQVNTGKLFPCIYTPPLPWTVNHVNFFCLYRWVLCANHMEPVKGFLARFLKRRLMETEIKNNQRNPELARIFEWIPKVWHHLNKFLETHSSSDVTIGKLNINTDEYDLLTNFIVFV